MNPTPPNLPPEEAVRPHVYDGIQEYDKRLPNWWLYTLYIMIVFWLGYWAYYEWFRAGPTDQQAVQIALARVEAQKLAANTKLDDPTLWQMSRTAAFVDAGKATYVSNCVPCHLVSLRGKTESVAAIGPDLTDQIWIHGGRPTQVFATINDGVAAKGMPTWGPTLGQKKITELVAYLLSKHQEGEPVQADPSAAPQPVPGAH